MKTVDFLDAVKARYELPSDYALHKKLEVTHQQISNYRKGKSLMGDDVGMRVSGLLGMPPGYVLACLHAERATDATLAKVWLKMANQAKKAGAGAAAALVMFTFTGGPDGGAYAATGQAAAQCSTLYIMSTNEGERL